MKRYLRAGEPMAIAEADIHHDADGFYIVVGPDVKPNETIGTVAIVHVRGALQHFADCGGDSYEDIAARVQSALDADPKPRSVLFRIESPGGVVAGLNECVLKLQRLSKSSKVPFVAFVDEMAASAAFALCCACEEILAPPSAVVGSIGVISTMVSQAKRDEADGFEFRIITSGKRKADGHPHAPITDDAVRAETERNAALATQFFALASKARGVPPKKLASLEAAIFLATAAKRVGLVDDVMSYDDVMAGLSRAEVKSPPDVAPNEGNVTDRRAAPDARRHIVAHAGTRFLDRLCLSVSDIAHAGKARRGNRENGGGASR